jgi:AhpD family alkylhydroperoxidase
MSASEVGPPADRGAESTTGRVQFDEVLPDTYKRLLNLNQHVDRMAEEHGVPRRLVELVKIRCSQVNGCAFCTDLHVGWALDAGEDERRLHLVATWRETGGLFNAQERAALALAEAVCHLPSTREVADEVYAAAAAEFSSQQLGVVVWAIAEIQTFNALNATSRKPLPLT